ncbi:MAG: hypothetical protein KKF46_03165 [Nanoarchaeota archaeon]|nr:hypothetical protein [Nanoarchaeota archaeon]MBU1321333.1 hypothetical protein [Nanoarchaeota archaeon]MBU1597256.1 hypothetical protein [Nanoarchaeota archaeon]MBU2441470.1 hypothetical protein [Nanoarchaeota archaeon]
MDFNEEPQNVLKRMDDLVKKVKDMRPNEMNEILQSINESDLPAVRERSMDICYDREECRMLGIPYSNIKGSDMARAQVYSHLLMKL